MSVSKKDSALLFSKCQSKVRSCLIRWLCNELWNAWKLPRAVLFTVHWSCRGVVFLNIHRVYIWTDNNEKTKEKNVQNKKIGLGSISGVVFFFALTGRFGPIWIYKLKWFRSGVTILSASSRALSNTKSYLFWCRLHPSYDQCNWF